MTDGATSDTVFYFGMELLVFEYFQQKLMSQDDKWAGFTPRSTFPMLLRNPVDPSRNTSFIVIIIDSQREVDIQLAPHFS